MTKLKMNITTKEDLKAENGRLKRELEVARKGIKSLQSESEEKSILLKKNNQMLREEEELYLNTLSKLKHIDSECENLREQLRQAREESVKYGKENEHLWGLLKIKMEG